MSDASHDGQAADAAADVPVDAAHVPVQTYIKASNTGAGDVFGSSVAISADGQTLAVGALAESSAATGVDGNQADNSAASAGAVYIFVHNQGGWQQQAYLKASNTGPGDQFGVTVALSGDGNTLAVGALGEQSCATGIDGDQQNNACSLSGAVYMFTRDQATWTQQAYIKASNTPARNGYSRAFGQSLALSTDGTTLAVGDPGESSNATGIDGDQSDVSVALSGAVFVFVRSGQTWTQQAYVKASNTGAQDGLGYSVALSADGNVLAAGADGEASSARGVNGSQTDNSMSYAGAVYVYTRTGTAWSQQAYVKASNTDHNDGFGAAVALAADGRTLAVGASGEASNATGINGNQADNSALESGAVYVFGGDGSTWTQQAYVKEPMTYNGDFFGSSLALSADGNLLATGAWFARTMQNQQIGLVYETTRTGTTWTPGATIMATVHDSNDFFGDGVSLSSDGHTLATSAAHEASAATGIGGNANDNTAMNAGAAYVIE